MEGSGSRSRFGFVHIMTDPDPGGPKIYGSYGSGSTTLVCVSADGSSKGEKGILGWKCYCVCVRESMTANSESTYNYTSYPLKLVSVMTTSSILFDYLCLVHGVCIVGQGSYGILKLAIKPGSSQTTFSVPSWILFTVTTCVWRREWWGRAGTG